MHGIEGCAGIHWQQWLYDQLVQKGYQVIMPSLPKAEHPNRAEWLKTVKEVTSKVDLADLVLIGHSLGVTTALDFIEQVDFPIRALISVSGFAEDYGAQLNSYFLQEREVDFLKVNKNFKQAFVLYGDDDPYVPRWVLKSVADNLGVKPRIFPGGGHLNTDSGYTTFPELIKIVDRIG